MSSPVTPGLSDAQLEALKNGCAGLLITVGDDGFPTTAFVWENAFLMHVLYQLLLSP